MTFLQITGDTLTTVATAVQDSARSVTETVTPMVPPELSIWDLAVKGGWIMIVLLILSIIACYIFVERLLLYNRMSKTAPDFLQKIRDYIREGKLNAANELCEKQDTPSARMIAKGIARLGRPMQDIQTAIENTGNIEVAKMEKRLPVLATIASGAPMIGFLGTVTGMVRAFFDMANAGTNVDISLLSGGIYEALVTTVGGLVVGIITLFAYNYLVGRIESIVTRSETDALEFMDLLNETGRK